MNKAAYDILLSYLKAEKSLSQRDLRDETGISLGLINKTVKELISEGYLDQYGKPTDKSTEMITADSPKRAVILAAGYGGRMVPINSEKPKALLMVNGERLIERQIRQLQEAGVKDISVVVGFQKEKFEYLIDKFGIRLVVNEKYNVCNNLFSLLKVTNKLENCYVIPSDVYCVKNPFSSREVYSWYMITDKKDAESYVSLSRKGLLRKSAHGTLRMVGISYLNYLDGKKLAQAVKAACKDRKNEDSFWEDILFEEDIDVYGKSVMDEEAVEINTYEDLQRIDPESEDLKSEIVDLIADIFKADKKDIGNWEVLKKGMTNRSFLFTCKGNKYVMRIPGEGTDQLINRKEEAEVYKAISGLQLCDDPVYLNPENGYKITRFINNVHCCDPFNDEDLKICMKKLKKFHEMKLKVDHEFNIFEKIDFYETLWNGKPSMYHDYAETKKNVFSLQKFINENVKEKVLTHIDAVPDNFLFDPETEGELSVQLSDWEYAGMQDTDVDIAMFCIYAMYEKEDIDKLIDIYYENKCPEDTRTKIYCYVAACGLLWSNWCEYKSHLGVEFGEYSLKQYRYGKDYYRYATERMH